ncbi:AAA family ATPase [Methanobrevibacter sp. DSM 116169]|uniref:AAA family ATPase n=1 Tax=Methanobrevibacter sp. DSM 116169 TaxID=3242727 RepID=UPI0038FC456B
MAKKKKSTLGKGLDSLIPDIYNEDFDEKSSKSLEEILNEKDDDFKEEVPEETITGQEVEIEEEVPKETVEKLSNEHVKEEVSNVIDYSDSKEEEKVDIIENENNLEYNQENIDEILELVAKNPRITLWSAHSAAVLRYLRKTEPEFSISKEASKLIDEAVKSKYPEIWELFES